MRTITSFRGAYSFLSNFYEDGLPGKTIEHRFQAAKAVNPDDAEKILSAATPGEAKRLGRRVRMRDDWDSVKNEVMYGLLMEKFRQPELMERLLNTHDAELVEGNTWGDTYWGVCNGQGKNVLGRLLEQVRAVLRWEVYGI